MKPVRSAFAALIFCCGIGLSLSVCAEIYKWIDGNGVTQYGDKPPAEQPTLEIRGRISSYTTPTVEPLPEGFFTPKAKSGRGKRVVMYSAEWCGVCKRAKSYFKEKNIHYTEYDIDKSEKARSDYEKLNGRGVPIILIGKQRMNGFSAERFEQMYYD